MNDTPPPTRGGPTRRTTRREDGVAQRQATRWQRGLPAWCSIDRKAHPRPDEGAGHRMARGNTDSRSNQSACDGRTSRDGDSEREKDDTSHCSHGAHLA